MMFVSNVMILAAESAEEEGEGIDLLLPATSELIAGILAFLIIGYFVWKWVFPTLTKTLEARQDAVRGELSAAEGAKVEAEKLREDYREQVAGARDEANRIVEEARQAGETIRADIVAKAEQEAEAIKARARDDLVGERERASAAIQREVASLSLDVAEKVIAGSLDREAQQVLVEQYISDLGGAKG